MVRDMAADGGSAVKMVVSYGGEIIMDTTTGKAARYAGGENRIVRVGLSERLSELRARLSALAGYSDVRIRYAVAASPGGGDGLDALHDVADEHDLWVLVTRLCCCNGLASRDGRVRAFLFPINRSCCKGLTSRDGNGIPRPASSPSLLQSTSNSKQGRGGVAAPAARATTFTFPRAQSAMALSTCTPSASSSSMALSSTATHVDSGFEALAEIAAAQRSATGASSSVTSEGPATVAVAGQQRVQQVFPPQANTAVLFLVAPVAVFFHAIPVYGCLIPAVSKTKEKGLQA